MRGGKTDTRNREAPFSVEAYEAIQAWVSARASAGVSSEYSEPHDFRRFVETNLAKKDPRQAQKALGHKSIDTTYDPFRQRANVFQPLDECR